MVDDVDVAHGGAHAVAVEHGAIDELDVRRAGTILPEVEHPHLVAVFAQPSSCEVADEA
ncbi:hypothetical protein D3C78_1961540 [compost metagenome]